MGKLRAAPAPSVGYQRAGDWFRAIRWLDVTRLRGDVDESCAQVANFLDSWESANGGPPFALNGSERMSSWSVYCGGNRELFGRGAGEQLLPDAAAGWYAPVDYHDL